jgi:hypothetical protein
MTSFGGVDAAVGKGPFWRLHAVGTPRDNDTPSAYCDGVNRILGVGLIGTVLVLLL